MYPCVHGLELGFIGVLPQGHDKVISRSHQVKIKPIMGENIVEVWLQFCSPEMSTVDKTSIDSSMEIYQNTPRSYRGNYRGWITLMSHLSHIAKMDQITQRLSCLDLWPVLHINLINPNPSTHGDMGWIGLIIMND